MGLSCLCVCAAHPPPSLTTPLPLPSQELGNALYPLIAAMANVPDAGKVTGMLLELGADAVRPLCTDQDLLKRAVDDALRALREAADDSWEIVESAATEQQAKSVSPAGEPALGERLAGFSSEHFDFSEWARKNPQPVVAFIAKHLKEPRTHVPEAAVEHLGVAASLYLLHCTLEVQRKGGMRVEQDGGRARTSGGVFIKLLRESAELPSEAQAMAWELIKRKGNEAKKQQQRKRMHQRASGAPSGGGRSPFTSHAPNAPNDSRSPAHRKFKQMTSPLTGGLVAPISKLAGGAWDEAMAEDLQMRPMKMYNEPSAQMLVEPQSES